MTVQEAIAARRSIRKFRPDPVAPDHIRAVLEAGRLAPSGCNCQPWRFIVVRDPQVRQRLAQDAMTLPGNTEICLQAPVLLACIAWNDAHCDIPERMEELAVADPDWVQPVVAKRSGRTMRSRFDTMPEPERRAYMEQNVAIALGYMMLQATELGYGTCWMGAFSREIAAEILGLPEAMSVVAITPLGLPAHEPPVRPRLPLEMLAFGDTYGSPLEL